MGGKQSSHEPPARASSESVSVSNKPSISKKSVFSIVGSSNSQSGSYRNPLKKGDDLIVKIMMPLYYTDEPVRFQDMFDIKLSWDRIVTNNSREFDAHRHELPFENCREWFQSAFYCRLFDVHPFCKKLFRDPSTQGKFLVSFFSFIFTVMDDEVSFTNRLFSLAESHSNRGIKSTEYSILGEVLFYTLRKCLGSEYDGQTHEAWVKLFSRILRVMVPKSLTLERKNDDIQKERTSHYIDESRAQGQLPVNMSRTSSVNTAAPGCPFANADAELNGLLKEASKSKIRVKQSRFFLPRRQLGQGKQIVTPI